MKYFSTRNHNNKVSASEAIIQGIAVDGGLFVPESIPTIKESFAELSTLSYQEISKVVLGYFLTDFTEEEIEYCVSGAYDEKFDDKRIVVHTEVDGMSIMELFHGPTIAFKDMALTILPYFMRVALKKLEIKEKVLILTATSGDTGKAALEGFKNIEGIDVVVYYPKDGVSQIQEQQMVTTDGFNTHVFGIKGNFDHAQTGVKELFANEDLMLRLKEKGIRFSSANSINIGRLIPQIIYYVHAYLEAGYKKGKEFIDVVVPTGNFGNILAAYYAKEMGIPIRKLVSASNENTVIYDLLKSGVYDANRELVLTTSPSMDILISSNLERLLYAFSKDTEQVATWMNTLKTKKVYDASKIKVEIQKHFDAGFASEATVKETIQTVYESEGYLLDPHTAVAYHVAKELDLENVVVASTASPYKFTRSVYEALHGETTLHDFVLIDKVHEETNITVPKAVDHLSELPIKHNKVVSVSEMKKSVEDLYL